MISDGIHTNPAALRIAHRAHPKGEPCQSHTVTSPSEHCPISQKTFVLPLLSARPQPHVLTPHPLALVGCGWRHVAPLWEGQQGTVLGAAAESAAVLTGPLSLCSAGLVLVTDAMAGMGLAPGRHTLGQQVVEIDGLNTYIAGKGCPSC